MLYKVIYDGPYSYIQECAEGATFGSCKLELLHYLRQQRDDYREALRTITALTKDKANKAT